MQETLCYRGFTGSIEYSKEDRTWYGKILDTSDLVLYEGQTKRELVLAFRSEVDDYIDFKDRQQSSAKEVIQ